MQQAAERPRAPIRSVPVIGVDVLADQRDFAHARIGKPCDLGDDARDRPRHFDAARIGHDAERAELVAAFLHGDERRHTARADRIARRSLQHLELVLRRKLGVDDNFAARSAGDEIGQAMVALRSNHDVDVTRAPDDLLAFSLRDTARNRDHEAAAFARGGLFENAQPAELGIYFVGRLLTDVTGIEDHQIGVLGRGGFGKSLRAQACPPYDSNRRRSSDSQTT